VQRHRAHVKAPSSTTIAGRQGKAFTALANLPTPDEVGGAYVAIAERIDAISTKAEAEGSLTVALMGLKELRTTVRAQAEIAGHLGSGGGVQVNTAINVDMGAAVKELIASLKPVLDPSIPAEIAKVLDDNPDEGALARLEAALDAPPTVGGGCAQ
jgi:hypothetical protein